MPVDSDINHGEFILVINKEQNYLKIQNYIKASEQMTINWVILKGLTRKTWQKEKVT